MKQKIVRSHKTEIKKMMSFWVNTDEYARFERIARNLRVLEVDFLSRTELLLLILNYADIYTQQLVQELQDARKQAQTHDGTAIARNM